VVNWEFIAERELLFETTKAALTRLMAIAIAASAPAIFIFGTPVLS
jgi:hypothetical protein